MYKGIYFDGRSAKPKKVSITIEPDFLVLSSLDSSEATLRIALTAIAHIQEYSGRVLLKINTDAIPQSIEVLDASFVADLKVAYPLHPHFADPHNFIFKLGKKGVIISLSAIVGVLALIYFVAIPGMITMSVNFFPKKYEIELGQKLKTEYLAHSDIDSAKTVYINDFYKSLKKQNHYPIHITVVRSEVMNAFALPGGEMVIYTGILDSMKNYSELIGLLGHETGHIEYRHSLKAIFRNVFTYLVVSILFQDYSGMMAIIVENAATIDQLGYSRDNETESDDFGYKMVLLNKGEPIEMAQLFQRMLETSDSSLNEIPSFIMTHPKLTDRIERIKKRIEKEKPVFVQNEKFRIKFQQARDGVAYE